MQAGTRRTLEFDRIMLALGRLTQTPLGREAVATVVPQTDPAEVRVRLGRTSEMRRHLALGGSISLSAPEEIESIRAALQAEGQALEPLELRALADLLSNLDTSAAGIERAYASVREVVSKRTRDRPPAPDIAAIIKLIEAGRFSG